MRDRFQRPGMVTARAHSIMTAMLSAATEPSLVARVLPSAQGCGHAMVALQTPLAPVATARLASRARQSGPSLRLVFGAVPSLAHRLPMGSTAPAIDRASRTARLSAG